MRLLRLRPASLLPRASRWDRFGNVYTRCEPSGCTVKILSTRRSVTTTFTRGHATVHVDESYEIPQPDIDTLSTSLGSLEPKLLDLKQKEQYADASPRLFKARRIHSEMHDMCQKQNLERKIEEKLYREEPGSPWKCSLHVQIPGMADEKTTAFDRASRKAREAAWIAMVIKLDRNGALAELVRGANAKKISTSLPSIPMPIHPEEINIMQQVLTEIDQADLSGNQEELTALKVDGLFKSRKRSRRPAGQANKELLDRLQHIENNPDMADILKGKSALPMRQYDSQTLELVSSGVYSIVTGATGSGKTTQLPQIILEDAIRKGKGATCDIICTQPRRIAASSVARRVAKERGESLGDSVGYQVRWDSKLPQHLGGSITYCTTGILLEQLKWNPDDVMDNTSHLVIDEIHVRDELIDFLLIVLKKAIKARQVAGKTVPKVILMSATMDTTLFSEYMSNEVDGKSTPCSSLHVPGRSYPVIEKHLDEILDEIPESYTEGLKDLMEREKFSTKQFLEAEQSFQRQNGKPSSSLASADPESTAAPQISAEKEASLVPLALLVTTIAHICKTSTKGAILVFLPGLAEISATEDLMKEDLVFGLDFSNEKAFRIHSLHSTVQADKQHEIFEPLPAGCRRIILSTNIAETSITVPDVRYVVDLGKMREKTYNHAQRITSLETVWQSQSNARQRAGRAGRVSQGQYYALYSHERREAMPAYGTPELLRTELQETCLSIKAQGLEESVSIFLSAAVEPPPAVAVQAAVDELKEIEAFTNDEKLTPLGGILAQLPIHPALGKMVILGIIFRCLDPIVTMAAMSTQYPFFLFPIDQKTEARASKKALGVADSDHLAELQGYRELRKKQREDGKKEANRLAVERFFHYGVFDATRRSAQQIIQLLASIGLLDADATKEYSGYDFGGEALNRNSDNMELLKCLLTAGFYPNIGARELGKKGRRYRTGSEEGILVHPKSINDIKRKADDASMFCFTTLARTPGSDDLFMRDTTVISPLIALLFGGRLELNEARSEIVMDGWLSVAVDSDKEQEASASLTKFRDVKDRMLNSVFKSLANPSGGALANDPVRDIFVDGLLRLLELNHKLRPVEEPVERKKTVNPGVVGWDSAVEFYNSDPVESFDSA